MRSKVVLAAVVFSLVAMAFWGAMRRRSYPVPDTRDLSGGAVVQRQRIDRAIEKTQEMNISETLDTLSQYNENFELAQMAAMSPSSFGLCYMKQVVADRRVSKVFEYLQTLPSDKSPTEASNIFDNQFTLFEKEWRRLAVTTANENTGPVHHAASCALFLCSYFCSPDTLNHKLQRWDEFMEADCFSKIEGVEAAAINRFIDPLFRLNLLVISGVRNGASVEDLNKELDSLTRRITGDSTPFLQVESVNLFKWDAETLDTDFTHVTRGVPATANSVLLQFPGFPDPNSSLSLQDKQVFTALEKTIDTWHRGGGSN